MSRDEPPDPPVAAPDGPRSGDTPADPVPEMDPRLAQRREELRLKTRSRRRRVLVAVGAGLAVMGIALLVARSSLFGVDTITVRGATRTSTAAVRAAADLEPGSPLLGLDEAAVARRVERLPFVGRAEVATELPDTVVITLTEREPVAWVQGRRTVAVLDGTGRILERPTAPPPLRPRVVGITAPSPPGTTIAGANVLRGVARIPGALVLRVELVRYAPGRTSLVVRGPAPEAAEIRIGSFKRVEDKAQAALAVMAELRRRGERVRYVDVRVPEAPATR